jgi:hypothetical protein
MASGGLTITVQIRTHKSINWLAAKALICLVWLRLITPDKAIEAYRKLIERTTWFRLDAGGACHQQWQRLRCPAD